MDPDWTDHKAYVRLTPVDKDELDIGDIVKLTHKDCADTAMGRVIDFDGWYILLNNSEAYFSVADWNYTILHTDEEK